MEKSNKKRIEDITSRYVFADEKDVIKTVMVCEALGNFLGTKRDYTKPETMVFNVRFNITKVIFNKPATIVYWEDGTKTVVKAENEDFDPEKGLAMAIAKEALGNKGNYFNKIKEWTNRYNEEN